MPAQKSNVYKILSVQIKGRWSSALENYQP